MKMQISNLTKKYGETVAVDNVSFQVAQGEVVGYLGPNGAGKSTTIKMLTGTLAPSAGQILMDGLDLVKSPIALKARIGYVPETGGVYESLTGFEYLQLAGRLHHLGESAIAKKANEFLLLFQLDDVAHYRLSSYSKGMRQKVLMASALIHNPDLLCLDEPLNGLDANSMLVFKELLSRLAKMGKTVFYCSHVLDVVERLCTRVIIIDRGRIVADSEPQKLKQITAQESLEAVFRKLTQSGSAIEQAEALSHVVTGS